MSRLNFAPTKTNQLALKRNLNMATQGHDLLEQKREILVMELMRLVDAVKIAQQELQKQSQKAFNVLKQALAYNGYSHLKNVASGIYYEHQLKIESHVVAGVKTPLISTEVSNFKSQYGFMDTDSLVDSTMDEFLHLMNCVNKLAELETSVWLLARELKKTQRRVNALEHIFIPNYRQTLTFITESIEGKELDSFFSMKMIKKRLENQDNEQGGF